MTQAVARRAPLFGDSRWAALFFVTLYRVREQHPFLLLGYALLPDHVHLLLRPQAPHTPAALAQAIRGTFARAYRSAAGAHAAPRVWQPHDFRRVLRGDAACRRHLHYIHYNPVQHGLVERPEQWLYSSFHQWKAGGAYADGWGSSLPDAVAMLHAGRLEPTGACPFPRAGAGLHRA